MPKKVAELMLRRYMSSPDTPIPATSSVAESINLARRLCRAAHKKGVFPFGKHHKTYRDLSSFVGISLGGSLVLGECLPRLGVRHFDVLCSCGAVYQLPVGRLRGRKLCDSCMTAADPLAWHGPKTFGRLTVVSLSPDNLKKAICVCACGKTTTVFKSALTSGNTKSCGCLRRNREPQKHPHPPVVRAV